MGASSNFVASSRDRVRTLEAKVGWYSASGSDGGIAVPRAIPDVTASSLGSVAPPRRFDRENVNVLMPKRRLFLSASSSNRRSKAFFLMCRMALETKIAEPMMMSRKRMTCCQVLLFPSVVSDLALRVETYSSDRLTVLRPASVIADTARKRLSMNLTLSPEPDEPQKMMAARRHVEQK